MDALAPVAARGVRGDDAGSPISTEAAARDDAADVLPAGLGPCSAVPRDGAARGDRRAAPPAPRRPCHARARSAARARPALAGTDRDIGDYGEGFRARYPIALPDPDEPADAAICAHAEAWAAVAAAGGARARRRRLYRTCRGPRPRLRRRQVDPCRSSWLDDAATRVRRVVPRSVPAASPTPPGSRPASSTASPAPAPLTRARRAPGRGVRGRAAGLARRRAGPQTPAARGAPATAQETILRAGVPTPSVRRHAERPLLGVRGRPDEPRRRPGRHHRPRDAALWSSRSSTATTGSCAVRSARRLARQRRGLSVTTVFGERFWIEAAGLGPVRRLAAVLAVHPRQHRCRRNGRYGVPLLPTAPAVQQGEPLEEVMLIRDEMANMVWGVERVVPLATGRARVARRQGASSPPTTPRCWSGAWRRRRLRRRRRPRLRSATRR